jgi:DNA polymerase-3 subunit beta
MLTTNRKELSATLAALKPAVNRKATLPVLAYVLATYKNGQLTLTATNLEVGAAHTISATPDDSGTPWPADGLCLEFAPLEAALKSKGESVILSTEHTDKGLITAAFAQIGSTRTRLPWIDAMEFPPMPTLPESPENILVVDTASFADTFSHIAIAATTDEARPVLTGVHMHMSKRGLTMEAADGYRLFQTIHTPAESSEEFGALVPAVFAKLLSKLTSPSAVVIVDKVRGQLTMTGTGESLCSQLINGTYPDLNQVIPLKPTAAVKFTADSALDALQPHKITLGFARFSYIDGHLNILTDNDESHIETQLPCVLVGEELPCDIAFNPDFLKSVMQAVSRKGQDVIVTMKFTAPVVPAVFTADSDHEFIAVVMPGHLN